MHGLVISLHPPPPQQSRFYLFWTVRPFSGLSWALWGESLIPEELDFLFFLRLPAEGQKFNLPPSPLSSLYRQQHHPPRSTPPSLSFFPDAVPQTVHISSHTALQNLIDGASAKKNVTAAFSFSASPWSLFSLSFVALSLPSCSSCLTGGFGGCSKCLKQNTSMGTWRRHWICSVSEMPSSPSRGH